jgi:hypothetical protein
MRSGAVIGEALSDITFGGSLIGIRPTICYCAVAELEFVGCDEIMMNCSLDLSAVTCS